MDEREFERVARNLGRVAGERIDVERVADGVLARLRAADAEGESAAGRPRPLLRWLAMAAAVALAVGGSFVTFRAGPAPAAAAAVGSSGLYDLSSTELTEVLDSLSWSEPVSERFAVGLDDLDQEQLETLLELMEG